MDRLLAVVFPEFQKTSGTQAGLGVEMEEEESQPTRASRAAWPPTLPERVRVVRDFLMHAHAPAGPETVARNFTRARAPEVSAILETLADLGQAKRLGSNYWV